MKRTAGTTQLCQLEHVTQKWTHTSVMYREHDHEFDARSIRVAVRAAACAPASLRGVCRQRGDALPSHSARTGGTHMMPSCANPARFVCSRAALSSIGVKAPKLG
jgi:hypothetical protein